MARLDQIDREPILAANWQRWKRALLAVLVGEVVLAAALRGDRVRAFLEGDRGWHGWLAVGALLYLLVVIYALARAARHCGQMLSRLASREDALAAHADTSAEWLWEATPELTLTYSSQQVAELLGYTPGDVVGRDAHEFMTSDTARRSRKAVTTGALVRGWRDMETEWLHADGSVVRLRHSAAPLADSSGRLLGYRGSSGPATRERLDARRLVEQRALIRTMLDSGDLSVVFQPILEARGHRLVGVEALARFSDGRPPDVWFDEAAEVGLRLDLELLAIRRALVVLRSLPEAASVSVNASPEVIADVRFARTLEGAQVALDRVVVEVTEHVRVRQYDDLDAALAPLRAKGLRLAVDDAGAGYASLSHVLRLRPDIIKLDRSLVCDVANDHARRTLIVAFTLLGIDIGATVTAEGVETAEELAAVTDLGVDHVQGYLIGRPSAAPEDWTKAFTPYP